MTSSNKSGGTVKRTPPTRKAAQARERANARRIVEQQRARDRRRKVTMWTTIGVVLVLIIAGGIGYGIMSSQDAKSAAKLTTPSVAVDGGTAFAVGTGPVVIDLYEDFMCPVCNEFEKTDGATIKQMIADNKVTVRYHPVAILNESSSGTNYSSRAAGAAAAAAQEGKFIQYHDVLYQNQPAEGSTGLDNAKLIELGRSVGLTGSTFADAVNNKTYDSWADNVTNTFAKRGYSGTPTVVIAGKQYRNTQSAYPTPAELTTLVSTATK
jgi:protein-disulfide isomerase